MGAAEGFGGSGGGGVREVRQQVEGACSSVPKKEVSPAFWSKIADPELHREGCQSFILQDNDTSTDLGLVNTSSPLVLGLEAKLVPKKFGKRVKSNGGCGKRSGMVQMDVSRRKNGVHDVNGTSTSPASSPSCNMSEKTQGVKHKNGHNCRCGDKRNSKVHKNRGDSFSFKNGFSGFNSSAGGNNFFGVYGLKPDIFDITKYVNDLSLDELLHGHYSKLSIAEDKGKNAAHSNDDLLLSVRKACSVLQDKKQFQAPKYAEIDNSCIQKVSTGSMTTSSAMEQTDYDKGDSCPAELPSDKVKKSDYQIAASNSVADDPLYLPKCVLERLALPPPKDLDLLLSDSGKTASSSKSCIDPCLGKSNFQRIGLPPFPWSHSISGHNKLGTDSVKLSANRSMCHGRWSKVKSSTTLEKCSLDLAVDFESLAFNQSLVPKVNLPSEFPKNETAAVEQVLSSSRACSTSSVPAGEHSPIHSAAKTLCEMATYSSKENLSALVKLLEKPSNTATRALKLNASDKSKKLFDARKPIVRPYNPVKVSDDGFPSKKLRRSIDVTSAHVDHTESVKRRTLHWSTPEALTSSPRKLIRHSNNAGTDSLSVNLVKKSYMMKPPRSGDRSSSSQQRTGKAIPLKWSRPEG